MGGGCRDWWLLLRTEDGDGDDWGPKTNGVLALLCCCWPTVLLRPNPATACFGIVTLPIVPLIVGGIATLPTPLHVVETATGLLTAS